MLVSDSEPDFITTDVWQTERVLRPVFMGCSTKNAKVITVDLDSLQRLIALRAVSLSLCDLGHHPNNERPLCAGC
jgi:hypothetical protein